MKFILTIMFVGISMTMWAQDLSAQERRARVGDLVGDRGSRDLFQVTDVADRIRAESYNVDTGYRTVRFFDLSAPFVIRTDFDAWANNRYRQVYVHFGSGCDMGVFVRGWSDGTAEVQKIGGGDPLITGVPLASVSRFDITAARYGTGHPVIHRGTRHSAAEMPNGQWRLTPVGAHPDAYECLSAAAVQSLQRVPRALDRPEHAYVLDLACTQVREVGTEYEDGSIEFKNQERRESGQFLKPLPSLGGIYPGQQILLSGGRREGRIQALYPNGMALVTSQLLNPSGSLSNRYDVKNHLIHFQSIESFGRGTCLRDTDRCLTPETWMGLIRPQLVNPSRMVGRALRNIFGTGWGCEQESGAASF